MAERAIVELGGERHLTVSGPAPEAGDPPATPTQRRGDPAPLRARAPRSPPGKAFGEALAAVGARARRRRPRRRGGQLHPRRGVRQGATPSATSRCSSPSSSWSRPRSACPSADTCRSPPPSPRSSPAPTTSSGWRPSPQANIRLCGSHAGVEIGADGPSQMALEDLADDAGRARLHGPVPERRHQHGEPGAGHGRAAPASSTCAPPAAPTRCSTGRTRTSRSAAPRSSGPARTTR